MFTVWQKQTAGSRQLSVQCMVWTDRWKILLALTGDSSTVETDSRLAAVVSTLAVDYSTVHCTADIAVDDTHRRRAPPMCGGVYSLLHERVHFASHFLCHGSQFNAYVFMETGKISGGGLVRTMSIWGRGLGVMGRTMGKRR